MSLASAVGASYARGPNQSSSEYPPASLRNDVCLRGSGGNPEPIMVLGRRQRDSGSAWASTGSVNGGGSYVLSKTSTRYVVTLSLVCGFV